MRSFTRIAVTFGVLALAGPAFAALTFTGTKISGDSTVIVDSSSTISIGTSTATFITIGNTNATTSFIGNVGIGTVSPGAALDVSGTILMGSTADVTARNEMLRFRLGSSIDSTGYMTFQHSGIGVASFDFGVLGNTSDGTFGLEEIGDNVPTIAVRSLTDFNGFTANNNKNIDFGSHNGQVSQVSTFFNYGVSTETIPLKLANPSTGASGNVSIAFDSDDSNGTLLDFAKIIGIHGTSGGGGWSAGLPIGGISFAVTNATSTFTEAMRITPTGYLGVGITAPSATLQVVDATNDSSTIRVGAASKHACLEMGASSGSIGTTVYVYFDSNAAIYATTTKPSFCQ